MNNIKITLIANAGLLIEYTHYKFLVDGIHSGNDYGFGSVDTETMEAIIDGTGEFQGLTGILFTHCHEDHFSSDYALKAIQSSSNSLKAIALPLHQCEKYPKLFNYLSINNSNVFLLSMPRFNIKTIKIGDDASIICFKALHAGEEYKDIENYIYLLLLGDKTILILGDADYDKSYFKVMLSTFSIDAVIVNPLYINKAIGRSILMDAMQPKNIIVCHIPHGKNSNKFLRELAAKDAIKYRPLFESHLPSFENLLLLKKPKEYIFL